MLVAHFCCNASEEGCCFINFRTSVVASLNTLWDGLTVSRSIAAGDFVGSQKLRRREGQLVTVDAMISVIESFVLAMRSIVRISIVF